jgi:hypothetical protein
MRTGVVIEAIFLLIYTILSSEDGSSSSALCMSSALASLVPTPLILGFKLPSYLQSSNRFLRQYLLKLALPVFASTVVDLLAPHPKSIILTKVYSKSLF